MNSASSPTPAIVFDIISTLSTHPELTSHHFKEVFSKATKRHFEKAYELVIDTKKLVDTYAHAQEIYILKEEYNRVLTVVLAQKSPQNPVQCHLQRIGKQLRTYLDDVEREEMNFEFDLYR